MVVSKYFWEMEIEKAYLSKIRNIKFCEKHGIGNSAMKYKAQLEELKNIKNKKDWLPK